MQRTVIGVLTYRRKRTFDEPAYFRQLSKEGQKLGSEVCFFSEDDLIYSRNEIRGCVLGPDGKWMDKTVKWPRVVIDRRRRKWDQRKRQIAPTCKSDEGRFITCKILYNVQHYPYETI
ncbi:hypothetical protein M5X11_08565 [Paenibacillus alginolyticus]|uniref:hypothetical protein n=1 Tax=Paenibacillus alginolyticus TaxID=59839 RepID=UPI000492BBEC|nr:hypothetical protein [Paenibacillus alginolyticus]MCY9665008.1 hypothetical protein [Paenibacillus alginolyticus]